jgi:hypothetical protein
LPAWSANQIGPSSRRIGLGRFSHGFTFNAMALA